MWAEPAAGKAVTSKQTTEGKGREMLLRPELHSFPGSEVTQESWTPVQRGCGGEAWVLACLLLACFLHSYTVGTNL